MPNTYVAPNFDLDTSVNIAGLEALKGGALTATDNLFMYKKMTLTVEKSFVCNRFYLNNNKTLNAAAGDKECYVIFSSGGLTITAGDTTAYGGFDGTVGTGLGYVSAVGSAGSRIQFIFSGATSSGLFYNAGNLAHIFKFCDFVDIALTHVPDKAIVEDCNLIRGTAFGFRFSGAGCVSFLRNIITDSSATVNGMVRFVVETPLSVIHAILSNISFVRSAVAGSISVQVICPAPIGTSYVDFGSVLNYQTTQLDRIEQSVNNI